MSVKFYADQDVRTTAVYVDGVMVLSYAGDDFRMEKMIIDTYKENGHYYAGRIIFGHGRIAMDFRTK